MTKLLERLSIDVNEIRVCPDCGAHAMHVDEAKNEIVWTCSECGCKYVDGRSDVAAGEAMLACRKNLLTPKEIRAIRRKYSLSRRELARLAGFGESSIKRWETGALLQNTSADRLLRLIKDDPQVVEKLREIANLSEH